MAIGDAHQFLREVDADLDLQTQVDAANWNAAVILQVAAGRRLRFTEAELQTAMDEAWGVLSEEELAVAAGGAYTQPNPPPGQVKTAGDVWSPPPGDTSGNSCLFGWKNK